MKEFSHKVKSYFGLHAQIAVRLAAELKKYKETIKIINDEKIADGKNIFELLSLQALRNTNLKIAITGENEEDSLIKIKIFFEENV